MSRTWMCVRCGSRPRWNETYLCQPCTDDPQQQHEVAEAMEQKVSGTPPRDYLVTTFRWVGKWSTRG